MKTIQEQHTPPNSGREENLDNQNASPEQPDLLVNRRKMLKRAGMVLGASGALAALVIPAGATSGEDDADEIAGLWHGVVSAKDNSFSPFKTFELYGGIWISSGQPDLTPGSPGELPMGYIQAGWALQVPRYRTVLDIRRERQPDRLRNCGADNHCERGRENLSWRGPITILR